MSGGHFNYDQYKIGYIADEVEQIVRKNNVKKEKKHDWEDDYHYKFSQEVIGHFKEAWYQIRKAEIYAQSIDWLVSGDDGENSFLKRLYADLQKLEEEKRTKSFDYVAEEA
jgi:hypothetical protein